MRKNHLEFREAERKYEIDHHTLALQERRVERSFYMNAQGA